MWWLLNPRAGSLQDSWQLRQHISCGENLGVSPWSPHLWFTIIGGIQRKCCLRRKEVWVHIDHLGWCLPRNSATLCILNQASSQPSRFCSDTLGVLYQQLSKYTHFFVIIDPDYFSRVIYEVNLYMQYILRHSTISGGKKKKNYFVLSLPERLKYTFPRPLGKSGNQKTASGLWAREAVENWEERKLVLEG